MEFSSRKKVREKSFLGKNSRNLLWKFSRKFLVNFLEIKLCSFSREQKFRKFFDKKKHAEVVLEIYFRISGKILEICFLEI
jgi:hypothetical protein